MAKKKNQNMPGKSTRGRRQDRRKVAGGQDWEKSYMQKKYRVSVQQVTGAIRAVGNDRKKVEQYLRDKK
jgi:hypothetical protein